MFPLPLREMARLFNRVGFADAEKLIAGEARSTSYINFALNTHTVANPSRKQAPAYNIAHNR